jgi:hypothetical protein
MMQPCLSQGFESIRPLLNLIFIKSNEEVNDVYE